MTYYVNVFISHSWAYSEHYETLASWIFDENWISNGTQIVFGNTSVPKSDPIHYARNERDLRAAIYERISASNVVVIPTGMYAGYSKWIKEEIGGAEFHRKPVLAVNPWGQERKSTVVANAADADPVGWQKQSVINGIWSLRA